VATVMAMVYGGNAPAIAGRLKTAVKKKVKVAQTQDLWVKEARGVASLLRLAKAGKASGPQIARLESKLYAGKNRLLPGLTANAKDSSKIYADVRGKFQGVGVKDADLEARIKNLHALGPNASWDIASAQLAPFQQNLKDISGKLHEQKAWAKPSAIGYVRQHAKQQAREHATNYSRAVSQPNIHKKLFEHATRPATSGNTVTVSGQPAQVSLYPQPKLHVDDRNLAVFHEAGGHGSDSALRQIRDMQNMQAGFRQPSLANPQDSYMA
jgi:hypothetical protein